MKGHIMKGLRTLKIIYKQNYRSLNGKAGQEDE